MAGQKRLRNGLTPKQNAFKNKVVRQIVVKGEVNATQAAMEVYDVKKRNVANTIAAENMAIPSIKNSIEEALNSAGLSDDQIAQNLAKLANATPDKLTGDTVLKANLEILKLKRGHYDAQNNKGKGTVKQRLQTLSFDDAKKELTILTQEATTFVNDSE